MAKSVENIKLLVTSFLSLKGVHSYDTEVSLMQHFISNCVTSPFSALSLTQSHSSQIQLIIQDRYAYHNINLKSTPVHIHGR
jgi:hypothetical protein